MESNAFEKRIYSGRETPSLKMGSVFVLCFSVCFFKASRFCSTALITSLSCRRKMADACLVQSVVLSQVSQVKMCTKISCLIKIFSFLFFPLDSSWAFGRTLLASIACDSRGWIISQERSWISANDCSVWETYSVYNFYWCDFGIWTIRNCYKSSPEVRNPYFLWFLS